MDGLLPVLFQTLEPLPPLFVEPGHAFAPWRLLSLGHEKRKIVAGVLIARDVILHVNRMKQHERGPKLSRHRCKEANPCMEHSEKSIGTRILRKPGADRRDFFLAGFST